MFPSQGALAAVFAPQHPMVPRREAPITASSIKREPFAAWSAVDDIKNKASAIGKEAAREYEAASQKAQQKTGKIELYSPQYYAACTFGGLLACVSHLRVSLRPFFSPVT
jgi:solute carrier family 25 (mitochondrial phosphate transporter), member 3